MHGKYFSSDIKQTTVPACSKNNNENSYLQCSDKNTFGVLSKDMKVIKDFISEEEEQQILTEIEPYLKRLRYETAHWDDAIHGFRETEKSKWTEKNNAIIQRVRDVAFPPGVKQISYVHVLDLKKDGFIKPHVDAVKFCGSTISGISLLSSSVMRLVNSEDKSKFADVLLERRDEARYKYSHEILKEEESIFKGKAVPKDRRISVICRNQP
ncbi:ALKB7-like protein [Mya arenaria]|uniref:ALKB7-like protein n=1 Tax=Mya arenaria TaxID=6604 RepID=A0ABY7G0N1_MYAAR|nr:ALKB7-like protein [Mya arenaria]